MRKRIEDRIEGLVAEIIDPLERRRRRQQAEVVGALRQQTVDEGGVGPVGREHRVGDALHRILVVVEAGGSEREVEIDHDGIQREIARDSPGDIVRDGGCADAAFGADDGDDAAGGGGFRGREQAADRTNHVEGIDRSDHVVADAATHQFAIGTSSLVHADHDDARSGVAHGCELIEASQNIGAAVGFENDHIRRGHRAIGFDGGGHSALLDRQMGLAKAPVHGRPHSTAGGGFGVSQ